MYLRKNNFPMIFLQTISAKKRQRLEIKIQFRFHLTLFDQPTHASFFETEESEDFFQPSFKKVERNQKKIFFLNT